jgi:hypothetical protein
MDPVMAYLSVSTEIEVFRKMLENLTRSGRVLMAGISVGKTG